MDSVVVDEADKHQASSLIMKAVDGRDIRILVNGGAGRFRDVFMIATFLIWMINHVRKQDFGLSTKSEPGG
jgi:hypothetical protein